MIVDVTILLTQKLRRLAQENNPAGDILRNAIREQLLDWSEKMGLPLITDVCLLGDNSPDIDPDIYPKFLGFTVLVQGKRCPYPKTLITEVSRRQERPYLGAPASSVAAIESWLMRALSGTDQSSGGEIFEALDFVAQLVVGAIAHTPDSFIDQALVEEMLVANSLDSPSKLEEIDWEIAQTAIAQLLKRPISLKGRRDTLMDCLRQTRNGWTAEKVTERLYGLLRPSAVEIGLNQSAIAALTAQERKLPVGEILTSSQLSKEAAQRLEVGFTWLRNEIYRELGLCVIQNIYIRCLDTLSDHTVQYRINDGWISQYNNQADFSLETLILGLKSHLLMLRAPQLWSVEDTEFLLAHHEKDSPTLVRFAYSSYGSLKITQVLRHLLRQGISIRDFSMILELLLKFQYLQGEQQSSRLAAEFVKTNLRRQITAQFSSEIEGTLTMTAFVLESAAEQALLACCDDHTGLTPVVSAAFETQDPQTLKLFSHILDIARKLSVATEDTTSILIVSTQRLAYLVEALIGADFPEIVILHRALIQPLTRIHNVVL